MSKVPPSLFQAFDPSKYTNKNMNSETVIKLKEVFDLFDNDHSGQISM
jgi:Ca2+-binding EF-hand superfamily protein